MGSMAARFVVVFATLAGCGFRAANQGPPPSDADPDATGAGSDSPNGTDASIDAPAVPADAQQCFGSGVVHVCLVTLPAAARVYSTNTQIDTDSASCEATTNPEAVGLCVIAGAGIQIDAGRTLSARGSKPLVLVSTMNITVAGTLDVSSHAATTGAGAEPVAANACVLGTQATAGGSSGGGYGGSFGGRGANGESNDGGNGGVAPPIVSTVATLRGGCAGGHSIVQTSTAQGGHGGGAVALVAAGMIQITGSINASGSGGRQGQFQDQGAGGGGSGGMIVLDAPQITNSGSVFANGGGGGEGNSSVGGAPGGEPTAATTAAPGGAGNTSSGGDGGTGSLGGNGGAPPGNANNSGGGGGGGGGGAGVIKASTTITGTATSPAPTP